MIRTPLQRHIDMDETLNEVRLFLPHFNKDNVETVMKALQNEEGSDIPADVEGEGYGHNSRQTWGYRPRKRRQVNNPNQMPLFGDDRNQGIASDPIFVNSTPNADDAKATERQTVMPTPDTDITNPSVRTIPTSATTSTPTTLPQNNTDAHSMPKPEECELDFGKIDREKIADFISLKAKLPKQFD